MLNPVVTAAKKANQGARDYGTYVHKVVEYFAEHEELPNRCPPRKGRPLVRV